jgi:plastocyanin
MQFIKPAAVFGMLLLAACAAGTRPDRAKSTAPESAAPAKSMTVHSALAEPSSVSAETAMPASSAASEAEATGQMTPPPAPTPAPAVAPAPAPRRAIRSAPAVKPVVPAKPDAPALVEKPAAPAPAEPVPSATPDVSETVGGSLRGQLELIAGSGQSLSADEMSHAVVYFVADSGKVAAKPRQYRIYTHNKQFEPESLVIPLGSTISFPNQDEILHNVFSVTPRSSFDLGIYGEGKSADYTFKQTGLVLINCNVHQAMQANVLVVDTPYIVSPGSDGHFVFDSLPSGSGKLMVWHPRANVQSQVVKVPAQGLVSVRLVLTKPRVSEHLNKERKPY